MTLKNVMATMDLKVKLLSHVRLCNPMNCSLSGSSVHGIFQARVLEWIAISFSRYAEYIVLNARLDEAQAGIKIAGRNISNLRYRASLVAQRLKRLPPTRETRV